MTRRNASHEKASIAPSSSDLTLQNIKEENSKLDTFKRSQTPPENKAESGIKSLFTRLFSSPSPPSPSPLVQHPPLLQYPPPRPPVLPDCRWSWDPSWRELYVYAPSKSCYLYISHHVFNEAGHIRHYGMASREDFTEEKARKVILDWNNWKIDAKGKWFLDVYEDGQRYLVFAEYWQAREGRWYVVERW